MSDDPLVLSLEECANGYCVAMTNAYRLIEDGEKLLAQKRLLGAVGSFQNALNEMIKGYLISKAVAFDDSDTAKWRWFWSAFNDRAEKKRVLENEIHASVYRDAASRARYSDAHALLDHDFVETNFDSVSLSFLPPGGGAIDGENQSDVARHYYEYIMGLFHAFNFFGLPNPAAQAKTFWAMKHTAFEP